MAPVDIPPVCGLDSQQASVEPSTITVLLYRGVSLLEATQVNWNVEGDEDVVIRIQRNESTRRGTVIKTPSIPTHAHCIHESWSSHQIYDL